MALSERQEKFLNWLLLDDEHKGSQAAFAKKIGVTPAALSNWKKDAHFRLEWEKRLQEKTASPERRQLALETLWDMARDAGVPPATRHRALMSYLEVTKLYEPKKTLEIKDERLLSMSDETLKEEIKRKLKVIEGGK